MKALPLALLFGTMRERSKRDQQNTLANCTTCNRPLVLPLTQPLSLISKINRGDASDNFWFHHVKNPQLRYPLRRAVLGAEPSKSELGIKEEMEFKHKYNNKN